MSSALRQLYQDVIMEHSRNPRNVGKMDDANAEANGNNPLCGDKISVYVKLDREIIVDAKFDARGCAISVACASMMTEMLKGKTIQEAKGAYARFVDLLTSSDIPSIPKDEILSSLMGVREFPTRIKCATLPWQTLVAAIDGSAKIVTTE
ncbi:MAG: Zinc-dependent sulfurtransferase SufU [Alphaproteobacteria bacterium MarineAlpha11_Bin1]|nr:MAG: Zinc-dependent sulfurtransferase SufU [Alphaproteobacteria bacterium MarineAlpha11_Bin1]|tara:strand:- start:9614 stop:10063 length:450 start_codon:yes stop_codon:yes gene_type:complete